MDAQVVEDSGCHAFAFTDEPEQNVLGTDV
jgi:hypothetical protein